MPIPDLSAYDEATLALLEAHIPGWRAAIATERRRRSDHAALWSNPRALRAALRRETAWRWRHGYSPNEEARGVDEVESDRWQAMAARIRELQRERRNQRARNRRRRRTA